MKSCGSASLVPKKKRFGTSACDAIHIRSVPARDRTQITRQGQNPRDKASMPGAAGLAIHGQPLASCEPPIGRFGLARPVDPMDCIAIHEVLWIGKLCAKKKRFGTSACDAIHIRSVPARDRTQITRQGQNPQDKASCQGHRSGHPRPAVRELPHPAQLMRSMPPMYGRRASGTVMLPSSFW